MGSFLVAWLVGLSLHIAQGASENRVTTGEGKPFPLTFASPLPPKPGQILVSSGIYIGLAILAEVQSLRSMATLIAWGYNISIGLAWAQNYSTEKSSNLGKGGTIFWDPPTTASSNLFPTGMSNQPSASLSSLNTKPGNPSTGGPMAA